MISKVQFRLFFLTSLLLAIFTIIFSVYFTSQEQKIYVWDSAGFWNQYVDTHQLFHEMKFSQLRDVVKESLDKDYNYLGILLTLPTQTVLSTSRIHFIISLLITFAIPALFSTGFFLLWLSQNILGNKRSISPFLIISIPIMIVFYPLFLNGILIGLIDVGAITLIAISLWIYFRKPFDKQDSFSIFLIALLLFCISVFRRWYVFWTIAFLVNILITETSVALISKKTHLIISYLKNLLLISFSILLLLFLIVPATLSKYSNTNYSDIYSAYLTASSWWEYLRFTFHYFGYFYIGAFLLSFLYLMKSIKTKKIAWFLFLQVILILIFFSRVTDVYIHHTYLFLIPILSMISLALNQLIPKNKPLGLTILSAYITLVIIIFAGFYFPKLSNLQAKMSPIFPSWRYYPQQRKDLDQIQQLVETIDMLTSEENRVYILAGSEALNYQTFLNYCLSFSCSPEYFDKILWTSEIDKRDGFPNQMFFAKYLVVATPVQIQTHLAPEDQRVIIDTHNSIVNQKNIGKHYSPLIMTFTLDNNIEVKIYKRNSQPTTQDKEKLLTILNSQYPKSKKVFKIE